MTMKVTLLKPLLVALSLQLGVAALANERLQPFEATLKATRFGTFDIHLDGKMYLKTEGDQWVFGLSAQKGAISNHEISRGKLLEGNQYRPISYEKRSKALLIKENIDWKFDWQKNIVTGKVKKESLQHTLSEDLYDPLSYQLALRQKLKSGQLQIAVGNLRYKNPETYLFSVIGEELLELNGQLIMTKIVKQIKPQRGDSKFLIWVAPELDYITLRFASYKKDKLKDLIEVTSLTIDGKPASF